jgi:hypothetical protein
MANSNQINTRAATAAPGLGGTVKAFATLVPVMRLLAQ